ncbi:MAG TPA: TonB-dependent receptor [Acetobacteraceae bacterium]|jgi:outer membrane receptor protein involved in Fe transport
MFLRRPTVLLSVLLGALPAVQQAYAAETPQATNAGIDLSLKLDVISQRLDAARQQIQPGLGASVYNFSPGTLAALPQGQETPLNQVLLQAPGVAQDSFGQIHLRGEHANVQYRLNGVELPEGLSVFGQALESRFADSMSLITGALPAQYGFQTAGVVDIQTRTGLSNPGLTVSAYGGSFNWAQPSFEYGGSSGPMNWFFTGDYLHNDRGIENPTASYDAIHDTTNQFHGLGYVGVILDPDTRLSLIVGGFDGFFQIPNNPGQPTLSYTVDGVSSFNSAQLNETQREETGFGILTLQKHVNNIDLELSAFTRYSSLRYSPDWIGDLLFDGIAQLATRSDVAYGVQTDGSWRINQAHTLRFGFLAQQETTSADTLSEVLPLDAAGMQSSDVPIGIPSSSTDSGGLYGVYVQDEWRILPRVTINGGLRFDDVDQFTHEHQVSPRLNVVWTPAQATTLHIGYARYFAPPPFELVGQNILASVANTTAAPAVTQNDPVKAERSHYFDAGVSQVVVPGLTVGVDAYYKISHDLIDEGQFGAPIILTVFNYAQGMQEGAELSVSYDRGPWAVYGNLTRSRAMGKDIVSAQFNFTPQELAYISDNWIHLDHDQAWNGSAGVAYTLDKSSEHPTRFSVDALLQSGLRASTPTIPNGTSTPMYGVVNLSVVQQLRPGTQVRLDVLNVGDTVYEIRNGTGVGVGAPQYGLRRTILAGFSQHF